MKSIFAKLAKLISKVHIPTNHKRMTEARCHAILECLKDGDIILTHTRGELSNVFLDKYGHAGIYLNGFIYEATTEFVKRTDPMFFLARKDDIKIMRPIAHFEPSEVLYFLEENLGHAYDFEFESGDGQFYCFELAAEALMCGRFPKISKVSTPLGEQFLAKSFMTGNFMEVS
jgi:hypothetical protein